MLFLMGDWAKKKVNSKEKLLGWGKNDKKSPGCKSVDNIWRGYRVLD
jgi:hypothetical protein